MKTPVAALLAIVCAACSAQMPEVETPAEKAGPTAAATREPAPVKYATQLTAPSPDYAAILKAQPPRPPLGELRREATVRPPADAKAVGDLWIERLKAKGVLGGYGLGGKGETDPVSSIDVLMTARDFDAWVSANGWSAPRHIAWGFVGEMHHPSITPDARAKVRIWPASLVRSGMQNQALLGGRIYLEDGCFYLDRPENSGYGPAGKTLVQFGAETGLIVDPEGYLALIDRFGGSVLARLGEEMHWAGPNWDVTGPVANEIRAACGNYRIEFVGNVDAAERFYAQYPHVRPKR